MNTVYRGQYKTDDTGRMIQPAPLNPGDLVFTIQVRSRYKYLYRRHGIYPNHAASARLMRWTWLRRPMSQAGLGNTKAVFFLQCDLVTISEDMAQHCDSQD